MVEAGTPFGRLRITYTGGVSPLSSDRATSGPTILVGHSYGGTVITEAGADPRVAGLVYVAARAPDAGEDYAALAKTFPTPPATAGPDRQPSEGRVA